MTTTKTVEQLKAELAIAEAAAAKEQQAKKDALREAQRAEAQRVSDAAEKVMKQKKLAILLPLHDALMTAGITEAQIEDDGIRCSSHPGPSIYIRCEKEYVSVSSWRSKETGRFVLTIEESYSNKRRYPQLKAGGYNVTKIVAEVKARVEAARNAQLAQKEKEASIKQRASLADQLKRELGLGKECDAISGTKAEGHYGRGNRYKSYTSVAPEGTVYFRVGTLTCTPAQARVIAAALAEFKKLGEKK